MERIAAVSFMILLGATAGAQNIETRLSLLEDHLLRLSKQVATCCGQTGGEKNKSFHDVLIGGRHPKDCTELYNAGYRCEGIYYIQPNESPTKFPVKCQMYDGGWTIIMNRYDGTVDFYRTWAEFKSGFGSVTGEHWLGNDRVHLLTNQKQYKLQVDFTYFASGVSYYAQYSHFRISNEANKYKLDIAGYTGNSGHDGLTGHSGLPFSTKDRENDKHTGVHCAQNYKGAFWHSTCHSYSFPFGLYKSTCAGHDCIEWGRTEGSNNKSVKTMVMKVKSVSC